MTLHFSKKREKNSTKKWFQFEYNLGSYIGEALRPREQ